MIQVVCWKWNRGKHPKKKLIFTHEHVNRLFNMVSRNLKIDHEFVCITDDPLKINPKIRIVPLWDDYRNFDGCYLRLKAFSESMKTVIGGRFVWIDLDCVIVDDITSILNRNEDFIIWNGLSSKVTPYNGSMLMMDAGARSQVWETFPGVPSITHKTPKYNTNEIWNMSNYVGTDQAWISHCLGPNEKTWNSNDGVYSFKTHIKDQGIVDLPKNSRIIFFNGKGDPSQEPLQENYPWIKHNWV